jgi:uncharacterized membrane protein
VAVLDRGGPLFFLLLAPVPRSAARARRETPLELLQRRYAGGEISTEEYEERKLRLQADRAAAGDG